MDAEHATKAAREAEQAGEQQRRELAASQGTIKHHVATFVEGLGKASIDGLQELPEDVQAEIRNRDLLRARHVRELRSALQGLLEAGNAAARDIVEGRGDSATVSELEAGLQPMLEAREAQLTDALEEARAAALKYNTEQARANRDGSAMGASAAPRPDAEGDQVGSAVAGYDEWAGNYLKDAHARESDAAMARLKAALADDAAVSAVLGLRQGGSDQPGDGGSLLTALQSAAAAIKREREHQLSDALAFFPCTALMHAGRRLLEAWQAESAAVKHLVQVHRMLDNDLDMNEECLDESGVLSKEKDGAVRELREAKEIHKKSLRAMRMLASVMDGGDQEEIEGVLQVLKLPADTSMRDLRQRVQEAQQTLTATTLKLTSGIKHPHSGKDHCLQQHFPEVILFVGQGLPSDLGVLWRPAQTLESYDDKELISDPNESSHKVWRVRIGGVQYAVKEYFAGQARQLQTCLKEAAVIHRHRHPAIVEIKALFQGSGSEQSNFYMQMPWYEKGALGAWAAGESRPPWAQVRSVLLDALQGLAHLHANGVIHGDVKPANILVDGRERGRLADFDISIDTKTRTSAASVMRKSTVRATAQGMTLDFAAPELKTSGKATRHTDMFAFGKTVDDVRGRCEPEGAAGAGAGVGEQARGQTAGFVDALTAPSPQDRPSAEDATRVPFFSILKDACQRSSKTCVLCDLNGDEALKSASAGVECCEGHFLCGACVSRHAEAFMEVENLGMLKEREGRLKCVRYPRECSSGFGDQALAQHLPAPLFKQYLEARVETIKEQMQTELEAEMKDRLEAELQRLAALDERARKVLVARAHIVNEILTLRCPRCRQAFVDFEGCFALKCSRCPCGFCGWCLRDCGADAHEHVRACAAKPRGADVYFGSLQQFEEAQRKRQKGLIRAYLDREVEGDLKGEVVEACRVELEASLLWPMGA